MNITNANQSVGFMPVSQSTQDSHEQNIQKQITSLQEKMRDITYNNEMPSEEKNDQKKVLQEKIQDLNSELKQYQIRKRQEEAEKRKEEAARKEREETAAAEEKNGAEAGTEETEEEILPFPESNAAKSILSSSNTKEHLDNLQKVRNDLLGKLRTAATEEEKARLRKRISRVSKGMGVNIRTISDAIADAQKNENAQKGASKTSKERKEDSVIPGKVIITRKRD
ncbi:MAG: FlxA-like family protein [Blautia sp.]|nr:FlxA-like family protein [Blautia sp.]MCM1200171.1 FlxA-like family protein [Bacteroides fragilis]